MEIITEQFKRIEPFLPVQRGNAILYVAANGCKWRAPHPRRVERWAVKKALDRRRNEIERLL